MRYKLEKWLNKKVILLPLLVGVALSLNGFYLNKSEAVEEYISKIVDSDGSLKRVVNAKVLKIGSDPNIGLPYIKKAGFGDFKGFEVEVSKFIADEIGCTTKIIPTNWENLTKGLEEKKFDIVISAIEKPEDNTEKTQNVGFSKAYYNNSSHVIVKKDNNEIKTLNDLKRKKVGVIDNSFGKILLNEINQLKKTNIIIVSYTNTKDLFDALQKNIIISAILDTPIATWNCENDKSIDCKKIGMPIYSKDYVVAVRKEDRSLLNGIDAILTEGKKNKKLTNILNKWNLD